MLQLHSNPILNPPPALHSASVVPAIGQPRHVSPPFARSFKARMKLENAAQLLDKIPAPGESVHLICNGNFASWDIVPAILLLTNDTIVRLDVATLGYNRANISEMAVLLTCGKIRELWLLYSHYFEHTSGREAEFMVDTMKGRNCHHAAIRSHAKILLIELARGDMLTIETSANLRSCKNIEQYAITNDGPLLQFHRAWIQAAIKDVEAAQANGQKA